MPDDPNDCADKAYPHGAERDDAGQIHGFPPVKLRFSRSFRGGAPTEQNAEYVQNNPSVMLRMTAPFTQRSLGKVTLHFLLYTKEPLLSLPFLLKGRWHKVPEGISHRFIRFIGGKRVSTAQYIVGLAFSSGHVPRRSVRKPAGRQAKPVCQARPAASPLPQKSPMDIFGDTPV